MHTNFSDLPSFDSGAARPATGVSGDLFAVAREAARTAPCATERAAVLAAWEGQRSGERPLTRLVDTVPYLGPLLVTLATTVWIYDLLVIVRTLLGN